MSDENWLDPFPPKKKIFKHSSPNMIEIRNFIHVDKRIFKHVTKLCQVDFNFSKINETNDCRRVKSIETFL